MTFGKRTASAIPASRSSLRKDSPQTRPGGYWLGLVMVPATFAMIGLGGGLRQRTPLSELLVAIPASALSLSIVAALVLLVADVALRALGWRQPWVFAVVCGLALYGLCFVTPVRGLNQVLLALVPGLCGGWILGWSRR